MDSLYGGPLYHAGDFLREWDHFIIGIMGSEVRAEFESSLHHVAAV